MASVPSSGLRHAAAWKSSRIRRPGHRFESERMARIPREDRLYSASRDCRRGTPPAGAIRASLWRRTVPDAWTSAGRCGVGGVNERRPFSSLSISVRAAGASWERCVTLHHAALIPLFRSLRFLRTVNGALLETRRTLHRLRLLNN